MVASTLNKMIKSASGTLTKLTKIRCVESYPLPSDWKSTNLFAWPNTKYLDEGEASFLESRGIRLRDFHVKTFSAPYDLYDKMKKVDVPSVTTIKITRTLLDVFQVVSDDKPITEITAAWDTAEYPNRTTPTSMSDTQGLKEFGAYKDSILVFHREGEKYDIKLRPFAFPLILKEQPELRDFRISRHDRRDFFSDKVDHKGRKNRNIVFQTHQDYLRDVLNETNDAVEKLIGNSDLVNEIKKLYRAQTC